VLVIAIHPILTQRTSNGTTHWSVGSPPDATTVQQDRSRFISHESKFTIIVQLINFLFTDMQILLQTLFKLKLKFIQTVFKTDKLNNLSMLTAEGKKNTRLHTSRRLTPCSAQGLMSLRRVTASRGWIPLHRPAMWNSSWPCRIIHGVFETYT
jgi:hypothetical protein